MVIVGLCVVVGLFVASPIQGKDKVKLTGVEVDKLLLKPGAISFGINHKTNWVWIVEALENGKRSVYWQSLANTNRGTDIGSTKIVGDQACEKWSFGPERCFDIYRVGEDKYESWSGGSLSSTWYRGQREYETKKDKVKLTEAECKERESQYNVFAGISHSGNTVWIIITTGSGKRELYFRSLTNPGLSMSLMGTARVDGDQICTKYTRPTEKCYDTYRLGEDKFEARLYGSTDSTYYKLK
jgi:hypothetical protein